MFISFSKSDRFVCGGYVCDENENDIIVHIGTTKDIENFAR